MSSFRFVHPGLHVSVSVRVEPSQETVPFGTSSGAFSEHQVAVVSHDRAIEPSAPVVMTTLPPLTPGTRQSVPLSAASDAGPGAPDGPGGPGGPGSPGMPGMPGAPDGPGSPWMPCGPDGPTAFHETTGSLPLQAAMGSVPTCTL